MTVVPSAGLSLGSGELDGSDDGTGEPDGPGVRSGDPWTTDGAGVGSSGGTVPADPLVAQAANRTTMAVMAAIEAMGFIEATPERCGLESNVRLPPSQHDRRRVTIRSQAG